MRSTLLTVLLAACLATSCATSLDEPTSIIVYLQHTKAEDMAGTLGQFLADARKRGDDYPGIRAHGETNSLLLKGRHDQVQQVIALINNLDVEQPK